MMVEKNIIYLKLIKRKNLVRIIKGKIIIIFISLLFYNLSIAGGYPDEFRLLHPEVLKALQRALTEKGYDPGPVDGIFGRKTMNAIKQFSLENRIFYNKRMNAEFIKALWDIHFDYYSAEMNNNTEDILEFYDKIGIKHF